MSRNRRDPHTSKLRQERIRRRKQANTASAAGAPAAPPDPLGPHPFASERFMRQVQALLGGEKFSSVEALNARMDELQRDGRLAERAAAWMRDDPKWRAQELAYDALETDSALEALRLAHEAQELDPDCTDAQRLMVALLPTDLENRIHLMREVVERAEHNFGEAFFEEYMGHFWGNIETRPYMRAKQHLGELLAQAGQRAEAAAIFERMLQLNPSDNQGMRDQLLPLYLAIGRPAEADRLLARYPEEKVLGSPAWARVLQLWLAGDLEAAQAALARARKVNPFIEAYITGTRPMPERAPDYFRPGEESEAQVVAFAFAEAWGSNPGFAQWLRAQR